MRVIASNNPMGININLGVYALTECICTGVLPSVALSKWCNVTQDPKKERAYKDRVKIDIDLLKMEISKRRLTNRQLADATGKTTGFFWEMVNHRHVNQKKELIEKLETILNLPKGSLLQRG